MTLPCIQVPRNQSNHFQDHASSTGHCTSASGLDNNTSCILKEQLTKDAPTIMVSDSTTATSKDRVVLPQSSSRYLVSWPPLLQIRLTVTITKAPGTAIAKCTFKLFTVRDHHFCKRVGSREGHPNSQDFEGAFVQLKIIMMRRATPSFVGRGLPMHGIDYHHAPVIAW